VAVVGELCSSVGFVVTAVVVTAMLAWLAIDAEGSTLALADGGYPFPAVILPIEISLAQLGVAWLESVGSQLFVSRCFLVLALTTWFSAKGKCITPCYKMVNKVVT
jgi:hypothetical protein